MPDAPSHAAASLTVLGGPLKGQKVLLEDAVDEILVGSDPDSRLCLDLPGVSPIHARIWLDLAGATVYDTRSARGVYVNDSRVNGEARLSDGDILWLGPPGEDESVMIQFRGPGAAGAPAAAPGPAAGAAPAAGDASGAAEGEPLAGLLDDLSFLEEPTVRPAPAVPAPPAPAVPAPPAPAVPAPPAPAVPAPPAPADEFRAAPAIPDEFLVDAPDAPAEPNWAAAGGEAVLAPEDEFLFDEPMPPAAPSPAVPPPLPVPPVTASPAAPRPPAAPAVIAAPAPAPPVAAPPAPPPAAAKPAAPAAVKAEAPAPKRPERPVPAADRPAAPAAPAPRVRPERPPQRRPAASRPVARYAVIGVVLILLLAAGGYFLMGQFRGPAIESIAPSRARTGEVVTVAGRNFSSEPSGNVVRFEGSREGRVIRASRVRLEVEVPEVPAAVGRPNRVPVTVTVGGRSSDAFSIAVYQAPRIHGLSPSVAMPGEEIVLAGSGWGQGASVRFGATDVPVAEVTDSTIKVRVPSITGPPGTSVPVVVSMGADPSNPAPFIVGRLPLLLSLEPRSAGAGDAVTIEGRGFDRDPAKDRVRIGGARVLVATGGEEQLKCVVPFLDAPAGEVPVEVKVVGLDNAGQGALTLAAPADPVDLRFSAEPFEDEAGHLHASVTTALGPVLVLSAAGGRSAAERAFDAQRRLNEAAAAIKASHVDVEMRSGNGVFALVLSGKSDPLVEVRPEDAAAYNEDWTKLKGRGGSVTPGRLASWWFAVIRDLALLLVRSEKPHYAASLAPEGKALADLFDAARKAAPFGVPRSVLAAAKPPARAALRTLALRVPATVPAPAGEAASTATVAGASVLKLDGNWAGTSTEEGERKFVTAVFTPPTGTLTYQRALSLTVTLTNITQARDGSVRFEAQAGRGLHYYSGKWDGQRIAGKITSDPTGQAVIGSFELERR
jgi:hypothetical protein